jgi:phenylacetate-CoA ligase
MLPWLARTAFRIQERMLGRRTFAILHELEQSEYWPRERREQLQLQRLQTLVGQAYEHTPYWRSVLDRAGFTPGDIRSLADLQRFPLLEKETLRRRREEMVWRDGRRRLVLVRTSGSTNEALQFYTDSEREAHIIASRIRGHQWIGIRRGDREMYFWGSPIELAKQDRIKRFRDFLINDGLTNAFELKPELAAQYYAYWLRWRPECLFAYVSSIVLMAILARSQGLDLKRLRANGLRAICTTSEMLTESDRQLIREAFDVPVYDTYGLREGGLIGHECAHFTMHAMEESVLMETIDPHTLQPTDGEGELVVTNLASGVMPIIRYRTGDMVTLTETSCPCGRTLRGVKVTGGRITDFVVTTDGRWIPGYFFQYVCRPVRGIVNYQIQQDRVGEIRLLLQTDEEFAPGAVEKITRLVQAHLSRDDTVSVELVEEIPPAPSGKRRLVVSIVAEEKIAQARSGATAVDG